MSVGQTPKQANLLRFIQAFFLEHGEAPTYREMRVGMGISTNSRIAGYMDGLVDRGRIIPQVYGRRGNIPTVVPYHAEGADWVFIPVDVVHHNMRKLKEKTYAPRTTR